jgi:hypothetical protein
VIGVALEIQLRRAVALDRGHHRGVDPDGDPIDEPEQDRVARRIGRHDLARPAAQFLVPDAVGQDHIGGGDPLPCP